MNKISFKSFKKIKCKKKVNLTRSRYKDFRNLGIAN